MKTGIIALIVLGALIGGFLLFNQSEPPASADPEVRQYENHGASFTYPAHYSLEEKDTGNGERARYSVILTEDTEENKAVREGRAPGREGPTAITLDIYQNDLDSMSAREWIEGTSDSNYKLSPDSVLAPRTLGGLPGFEYRWSGLYEARAVAVANDSFVYSFTATYLTPSDPILTDFEAILQSVRFK